LGCKAWIVQVEPISSPRQISRTELSTCKVTALCGASRHDVSLPGRGPQAEP
jgi:hypothetical protein